jgi:hypothetical protein
MLYNRSRNNSLHGKTTIPRSSRYTWIRGPQTGGFLNCRTSSMAENENEDPERETALANLSSLRLSPGTAECN